MKVLIFVLIALLSFSGLDTSAQSRSTALYISLSDIQSVKVINPAEEILQTADTLAFKESEVVSLTEVQIEKIDTREFSPEEYSKLLTFRDKFYIPGSGTADILPDAAGSSEEMTEAPSFLPLIVYCVFPL